MAAMKSTPIYNLSADLISLAHTFNVAGAVIRAAKELKVRGN
jgi:hypothetical protein